MSFKAVYFPFILSLFFLQSSIASTQKNRLNIALENDPAHFDPRMTNDLLSAQVQALLYRGLFKEDKKGNIISDLAESYHIDKEQIITIILKEALWSDGKKITAFDFEKSIKEALSPKFPSSDLFVLYSIKNAQKAKSGHVCTKQVRIFAKAKNTLVIEFKQKDKDIIKKLTSLIFRPYRKEAYSGPYCIKEYKPANYLVLEKNPRHELQSSFAAHEIKFNFISDRNLSMQLFLNGQLDIIGHPFTAIPPVYKTHLNKQFLFYKKDVLGIKLICFNCEKTFKNRLLRKAFSHAIERNKIIKDITQQSEKIIDSYFNCNLLENSIKFDPEIAKNLFKANPIKQATLIYANDEVTHLIAQHIQTQLQSIFKIKVHLEKMELAHLRQRLNKKDYDFCLISWFADIPDYKNIFERLKTKNNYKNITGFSLPKLNFNNERTLQESIPVFPLFQWNFQIFSHKNIKNINITSNGIVQLDKVIMSN